MLSLVVAVFTFQGPMLKTDVEPQLKTWAISLWFPKS